MKDEGRVPMSHVLPAWLHRPLLPWGLAKEIRAVMPVWLLAAVWLIVAGALAMVSGLLGLLLGSVALGATVFGHEFTHRTLASLLVLPVSRRQLWRTKMVVLLGAQLTLSLPFLAMDLAQGLPRPQDDLAVMTLVMGLASLSGLCVAPWLTMLTRSPLAGAVFTAALPVCFWVLGDRVAAWVLGPDAEFTPDAGKLRAGVFLALLVAHWVVGGWCGYRKFIRLEVTDGPKTDVGLPRVATEFINRLIAAAAGKRGRVWVALVRKEIRMQHVSLVVGGLFAVVWLLLISSRAVGTELGGMPWYWGVVIYAVCVPLLVGVIACTEERQMGTLEWSLSLPISVRWQWLVKAAVVVTLALFLGLALPGFMLWSTMDPNVLEAGGQGLGSSAVKFAPVVGLLACVGLYVSSIATSSVRALLGALPFAAFVPFLHFNLVPAVLSVSAPRSLTDTFLAPDSPVYSCMLALVLGRILLAAGLANYRTVEFRAERVVVHFAWVVGALILCLFGFGLGGQAAARLAHLPEPPEPAPESATVLVRPTPQYYGVWTGATKAAGFDSGGSNLPPSALGQRPDPSTRMMLRYGLLPRAVSRTNPGATNPPGYAPAPR